MDLDDLFGPIDLYAENRWEAIDELINYLVSIHKIKSEHSAAIAAAIKKRESSWSTGVGAGIGIPHASTDLILEPVGILGRSRKGIQFNSPDREPVTRVILFLVPEGQYQIHLHSLANLAKMLQRGL